MLELMHRPSWVVADGGAQPTPDMVNWATALAWELVHPRPRKVRLIRCMFVWRKREAKAASVCRPNGSNYLIQAGRLAAYLQAWMAGSAGRRSAHRARHPPMRWPSSKPIPRGWCANLSRAAGQSGSAQLQVEKLHLRAREFQYVLVVQWHGFRTNGTAIDQSVAGSSTCATRTEPVDAL